MLDHNPIAKCTIGERYEAHVPDTLDLADRMGLGSECAHQCVGPGGEMGSWLYR